MLKALSLTDMCWTLCICTVLGVAIVMSHISQSEKLAKIYLQQQQVKELDSRIIGWVSMDKDTHELIYTPRRSTDVGKSVSR